MPTTVTSTIGTTGRTYSTLQAWEDACPANLVTADQVWRGEAYNDSQFTAGVVISGQTTDATRYVELTVATGQSFCDNANVRTNALRYNQSNGVGISVAFVNPAVIDAQGVDYTRISRFQVTRTTQYYGGIWVTNGAIVKDCIVGNGGIQIIASSAVAKIINCLSYGDRGLAFPFGLAFQGFSYSAVHEFIGCTAVLASDQTPTGTGFNSQSTGCKFTSCAAFGFSNATSGSVNAASDYNATDLGSGFGSGAHNVYGVTYNATTPLTQASAAGSLDFRAIAATALAGAGFLDSTNAPLDISGYTRAASPTIGAWELAVVAATKALLFRRPAVRSFRRSF